VYLKVHDKSFLKYDKVQDLKTMSINGLLILKLIRNTSRRQATKPTASR